MEIKSFVFDFDGTLAELRLDFAEMKARLNSLAARFFEATPPEPFLPVLEWLTWLENNMYGPGIETLRFRQEALDMISKMELQAATDGALFPFARPLLKMLAENGAGTAIITRNSEAAVRIVFPDILNYCPVFLPRERVLSPKPDPAHLLHALDLMGADRETAIIIGDHPLDIQTGKAAGIMTAGVCSGNSFEDDLIKAGADWVADNCQKLVEHLSRAGKLQGALFQLIR